MTGKYIAWVMITGHSWFKLWAPEDGMGTGRGGVSVERELLVTAKYIDRIMVTVQS